MPAVTPSVFAKAFLLKVGLPLSSNNVTAMTAWEALEGGHWAPGTPVSFNPLNTTYDEPGEVGRFGVGIREYSSWAEGLDATVKTITAHAHGYPVILEHLAASSAPSLTLAAVDASDWGTHGSWSDDTLQMLADKYGNTPDPTGGSLSLINYPALGVGVVVAGILGYIFWPEIGPYVRPIVQPVVRPIMHGVGKLTG
jgi:hypothetical protein